MVMYVLHICEVIEGDGYVCVLYLCEIIGNVGGISWQLQPTSTTLMTALAAPADRWSSSGS